MKRQQEDKNENLYDHRGLAETEEAPHANVSDARQEISCIEDISTEGKDLPWEQHLDDDNVPYYHHTITEEITYDRPAELSHLESPWMQYFDDEINLYYYHNPITGVTTYDMPPPRYH